MLGVATDAAPPLILRARTADLAAATLLPHCPDGYSFLSVDAGHEADDVAGDMALAASVLSPGGVAALEDALSLKMPGVAKGLFRYLGSAGSDGLAAFAPCANKLFLCQPEMHPAYLACATWLLTQGRDAAYLQRSCEQDRASRALLFIPRLSGREIVAFGYGAVAPAAASCAAGATATRRQGLPKRRPPRK